MSHGQTQLLRRRVSHSPSWVLSTGTVVCTATRFCLHSATHAASPFAAFRRLSPSRALFVLGTLQHPALDLSFSFAPRRVLSALCLLVRLVLQTRSKTQYFVITHLSPSNFALCVFHVRCNTQRSILLSRSHRAFVPLLCSSVSSFLLSRRETQHTPAVFSPSSQRMPFTLAYCSLASISSYSIPLFFRPIIAQQTTVAKHPSCLPRLHQVGFLALFSLCFHSFRAPHTSRLGLTWWCKYPLSL